MTSPEELTLAAEFDQPTREQWRELVRAVLARSDITPGDESSPELALATETYDGVVLRPLYTGEDALPPAGFPGFPPYIRGSRPAGAVAAGWDVRQRYAGSDVTAVNEAVLADLAHGVTSLWLAVGEHGTPVTALGRALDGVRLDLAAVVLDAGVEYRQAAEALLALHREAGVPTGEVRGNLGIDPLAVTARTGAAPELAGAADLAVRSAREHPALLPMVVDAAPYHEAGGSDAEELAVAIATGVTYLRALTGAGLPVGDAVGLLEFRYAATADQFATIAKLRAARRLWGRVTEVCGAPRPPRLHAVTSAPMMTGRDPWVNMLRTTLACFGAAAGGADAITVRPFDEVLGLPDGFARRIARNTSSILLEESKLAAVVDPAGGSWYVERLTDELARAAWAWFTDIEAAGGAERALASGMIADRLAATWARRSANIAHRRDPITGVSEFPNLAERLPERDPAPRPASGGLPRVRYAAAFERLRDRADAHAAAAGARPAVFLATLGPVAEHTARAGFARNLLAAGGIEAIDPGSVQDVVAAFGDSGARVACLAGSEAGYGEHAAEVSAALRRAGAQRVLLTGRPRDGLPDVDGYLHAGCDALAVLTDLQRTLGVA